ncbi:hypothetical protein IEO70_01985 [Bacillus sp. AGMB 02131]|uniref:Uncharacterized protein n=1 Tax=Peribacillus faecalis TaxID=2772559 RepID=A0A927HB84_9BACI|nr:hypothetical protein [Peribacillus faecalis]MBD3107138.1 hypothetical protein [Peribacillus faecalis]
MQLKKQEFLEILQYAYSKGNEQNITTQELVNELKNQLQSIIEHNKRGVE